MITANEMYEIADNTIKFHFDIKKYDDICKTIKERFFSNLWSSIFKKRSPLNIFNH